MFFISLAYTYIYICFILKKKEEMKNMKRDNKARREMKRYLLYMYICQKFFFSFTRKEKKKTKKNNDGEREGDKFLSTYQKLSSFFFFRQNSFWGQVFMSFFMSLKKVSRRGILLPFFS